MKPQFLPRNQSLHQSKEIYKRLNRTFRNIEGGLNFTNPFELLVATILSAQCTDARVNLVTPHLFSQFPTPFALGKAKIQKVEEVIRSINFYRTKAKNIISTSKIVVEKFEGAVPANMGDLLKLPGVGRKTANVVLNYAFNQPEGIAVETHVIRVTKLLGLTNHTDPKKIEQDLIKLYPKKQWAKITPLFISLGQEYCMARHPHCALCPVRDLCKNPF